MLPTILRSRLILSIAIGLPLTGLIVGLLYSNPATRLYREARELADAGREEQALRKLQKLVSQYPAYTEAYISQLAIAINMEEPDVNTYISKARFALKNDALALSAINGLEKLQSGNNRAGFQILSSEHQNNPDLLALLADTASDLGEIEQAKTIAKTCLQLAPGSVGCQYDELMLQVSENDFSGVAASCSSRLNSPSWLYIPCGLAELGLNQPENARRRFQALSNIVVSPDTPPRVTAHAWEIDTFIFEGRLQKAAELSDLVSTEHYGGKFTDERRFERANIAFLRGDLDQAQKLAEALLKVAQDDEVIGDTIVLLAKMRRNPKHAEGEDLSSVDRYLISAFDYDATGHYAEAAAELERAYQQESYNTQVQYELSVAYMKSKQTNRAIAVLEKIIADKGSAIANSDPYYWVAAHYQLASCFESAGEMEKAKNSYTEFLSLWRNADSDLDLVVAAKQHLRALER